MLGKLTFGGLVGLLPINYNLRQPSFHSTSTSPCKEKLEKLLAQLPIPIDCNLEQAVLVGPLPLFCEQRPEKHGVYRSTNHTERSWAHLYMSTTTYHSEQVLRLAGRRYRHSPFLQRSSCHRRGIGLAQWQSICPGICSHECTALKPWSSSQCQQHRRLPFSLRPVLRKLPAEEKRRPQLTYDVYQLE